MTGLPNGVRDEDLVAFTLQHPRGVRATYARQDYNGWVLTDVTENAELSDETYLRCLNELNQRIEQDKDAFVIDENP